MSLSYKHLCTTCIKGHETSTHNQFQTGNSDSAYRSSSKTSKTRTQRQEPEICQNTDAATPDTQAACLYRLRIVTFGQYLPGPSYIPLWWDSKMTIRVKSLTWMFQWPLIEIMTLSLCISHCTEVHHNAPWKTVIT